MDKLLYIIIAIFILKKVYSFICEKMNEKYNDFVFAHSMALKNILNINKEYAFKDIPNYDLEHYYDNENFFDIISPKDYLTYQLVKTQNDVKKAIDDVDINNSIFPLYENSIKNIELDNYDINPLKNRKKLKCIEKRIFEASILKPTLLFSISVRLSAPYSKYKCEKFNSKQIEEIIIRLNEKSGDRYLDKEIWKSISNVERGKVTNKLRFAVYKRDNYRCQKCGSTENLEIDHIFPIAKGGKTVFNNLQTLCHDCNSKKSDIIEHDISDVQKNNICPFCGVPLVQRKGKYGVFYGCPNYPNCKFIEKNN